jgi:hypothetical protein
MTHIASSRAAWTALWIVDIAVQIDFDQVRCRYLVPAQTKRVEQEVMIRPGNTRRNMVVNQRRGPSIKMRQPIGGSEIEPYFPFFFANAVTQ